MNRIWFVLLLILPTVVADDLHTFGPQLPLDKPLPELIWIALGSLALMMVCAIFLEKNVATVAHKVGQGIGTGLLALASSLPVLVICATAALSNRPDIALATVIATNIANLTLVLGTLAFIKPLRAGRGVGKGIFSLIILTLGITLIFFAVTITGTLTLGQSYTITNTEALIYIGLFFVFLFGMNLFSSEEHGGFITDKPLSTPLALIIPLGALVCWLGNTATLSLIKIAEAYQWPALIISSVLVVVGTSFPEFAIGLVALFHREDENVFSNLISSSAVNYFLGLGIVALLTTLTIDKFTLFIHFPFMLISIGLALHYLHNADQLTRAEGFKLLCFFAIYSVVIGGHLITF